MLIVMIQKPIRIVDAEDLNKLHITLKHLCLWRNLKYVSRQQMLIKDIKADDKISCLIYNVVPELQMIAK